MKTISIHIMNQLGLCSYDFRPEAGEKGCDVYKFQESI